MIIGRLKQLRDARHLSQQKLADALQVAQATVASWEVGRTEPSHSALNAIADYFNVSTDYLLGRESQKCSLSEEQASLINNFEDLDEDGRNLLKGMLSSLKLTHARQRNRTAVVQNNSGGTNFLATGGNNKYSIVAS